MNQTAPELEKAVLGSILRDSNSIRICVETGVSLGWFANDIHAKLYHLMLTLFREGKLPETLLVLDQSSKLGIELPKPTYLDDCVDVSCVSGSLPWYLNLLRGFYQRRILRDNLTSALEDLKRPDQGIAEVIAIISATLTDLNQDNGTKQSLFEIGQALLTEWQEPKTAHRLLSWPLRDIDTAIGKLSEEYICLASQESQGKTAFAVQMAANLATHGIPVSIKSLESRTAQIVTRLISHLGQVNTLLMRQGKGLSSDFAKAVNGLESLRKLGIDVCDKPANTDQLRAWAHNERGRGSRLLIVDNLKHIQPAQRYNSLPEMFRDFSLQLKWIRDEVKLPLMVLHHLSKDDDVSWSRDLRRDVDILIFLKANEQKTIQPSEDNDYIGQWFCNLEVVKNRDGQSGMEIPLEFDKYRQTFRGTGKTQEEDGL